MRNRLTIGLLAWWVLLAGCAGNGAGLDANGQPLTPGGGGDGPLMANFDSIQAHVFTPICTECHAGGNAPQGLRLDSVNSYNLLVNVSSNEVPGLTRVLPGDPDNSYVIQKLEGHAAVGARMPLGGPYLPSDTMAVIRQWITDGAGGSSASANRTASEVTAAPAIGDVLIEPPPQIMLGFARDLDVTRMDSGSVRVERRTSETEDAPVEIVTVRIAVSSANPRALLIWPQRSFAAGHYRVLMRTADVAYALVTEFTIEAAP